MHLKSSYLTITGAILIFLAIPGIVVAQSKNQKKAVEETQYGVGFQATFPAYGISGMIDINDKISAQGILGFFGSLRTYAIRGLYRFKEKEYWNLYGYGMIGAWSYTSTYYYDNWRDETETVMGFGLGAGFEYDWRGWDSDLPPIFWNGEIGLGFANFSRVAYSYSTFSIGVGVHYRF